MRVRIADVVVTPLGDTTGESAADPAGIMANFGVGFVAISPHWRVLRMNAPAGHILGLREEDVVGADVWQQFPGARELEFGRVFERVMTTRQSAAFEAHYPGPGRWFELRVQPTDDGIGCFFLDITDRHLAEERAAAAVARAEFIREVTDALSSHLDVVSNVNRLARLVVPHLGTWSVVSVAEADGRLVDTAWWHPDPDRLRLVGRYVEVRQRAMPGTIADGALQERRPVALLRDAHARIRARLDGEALARFDDLAPVGSAVLPMIARGRTIGLLTIYADTELSEQQYETGKDVAARAALALDNSLAYERESAARADAESARAAAESATGRLALLARVGEALSGSEHPDIAVGTLARLVVPQLADWSIVTVVDDEGEARDIGSAHRDPALEPVVAAYAARRSANLTDDSPLRTALGSGRPWVTDAIDDSFVRRVQSDGDAVGLLDQLHPHGVAVIPLTARGRVFGALTLVTTRERGSHHADELAVAHEVARRAAPVLDSARSAHRARRLAEVMQRSVLAVPAVPPGLDIAVRYRPAQTDNEVGGDWYDHFDLPDGSTFVAIGDVMGHDIDAIAAMAQLRTLMRAAAWTARRSPAEVVTDTDSANRALGPGTMATCLAAVLDPQPDGTLTLRWSSAGHPPLLVVDPDGTPRLYDDIELDPPLGVRTIVPRREHSATLAPGALVLLFTDGLVERRERPLDEGLAALCRAAVAHRDVAVDDLVDRLLTELAPPGSRHDDIAVLALRVTPVSAGSGDRLLVRLAADTAAPATARTHLRAYTRGLPVQVVQDAALITSELVTNALRHGTPPVTLDIRRLPDGVRVAVNDRSDDYPVLPGRDPAVTATSGRGLLLTDLLATSWGIDPAPAGKTVWFTMIGSAKVVGPPAAR